LVGKASNRVASMNRVRWLMAAGFAVFMALVIYSANQGLDHPGIALVRVLPFGDKLGHIVLWGTFAFFINLALGGRTIGIAGKRLLIGPLIAIAIVSVEEASQGLLSNRTLDAGDMVANLVGIGLATVASTWYISRRKTKTTADG